MPNKRKCRSREGYKARYKNYKAENRASKNKEKKLQRHLKKHPNDIQAKEKTIPKSYKRVKKLSYWEKFNLDNKAHNRSLLGRPKR